MEQMVWIRPPVALGSYRATGSRGLFCATGPDCQSATSANRPFSRRQQGSPMTAESTDILIKEGFHVGKETPGRSRRIMTDAGQATANTSTTDRKGHTS